MKRSGAGTGAGNATNGIDIRSGGSGITRSIVTIAATTARGVASPLGLRVAVPDGSAGAQVSLWLEGKQARLEARG